MRAIYLVLYCCVMISLFITFLYLMVTVVDPGLMSLSEKASLMVAHVRNKSSRKKVETVLFCQVMCKAQVFVTIFSIVLIALFVTFCYLMSTVDPPPVKLYEDIDYGDTETPSEENDTMLPLKQRKSSGYYDDVIIHNDDMLPPYRRNHIIQEKMDGEGVLETSPASLIGGYKLRTRKVIPPVLLPRDNIKNFPYKAINNCIKYKNTTESENVFSLEQSVKGRRRSVQHFEELSKGDDSGFVILNIVDDTGQSRIKVKLNSVKLHEPKRTIFNATRPSKSGFRMEIQRNNSEVSIEFELPKKSIITLMPNNTVVIDEFDKAKSINYSYPAERKTGCNSTKADKVIRVDKLRPNLRPHETIRMITEENNATNKTAIGKNHSDTESNLKHKNNSYIAQNYTNYRLQ